MSDSTAFDDIEAGLKERLQHLRAAQAELRAEVESRPMVENDTVLEVIKLLAGEIVLTEVKINQSQYYRDA